MNHGSFFSGIGGFDLAAQWMGWNNKFHCEWNKFGQKVLHHYWPEAKQYTDITQSSFLEWRGHIDIITGGFPCQPYSMAGKRKGKEDERHLWPEMLRVIREVEPRWVVGENVLGLVNWNGGLVFHEVQVDLEAQGYEVFPYVLPAVSVNAPHRRDRVWFVAYAHDNGLHGTKNGQSNRKGNDNYTTREDSIIKSQRCRNQTTIQNWDASNANGYGFNQCDGQHEINASEGRFDALGDVEQMGESNITNTMREGLQSFQIHGETGRIWKKSHKQSTRFFRTEWERFPTQSPICFRNDGFPNKLDGITFSKWRQESIKAGGNAVVPQVVLQIFKAIEQFEKLHK